MIRAEALVAELTPAQRERLARLQEDPRAVALLRGAAPTPARAPVARGRRRPVAESSARREGDVVYLLAKGLRLDVTPNSRLHHQEGARHRAAERDATARALAPLAAPPGPWRVTITRVSPGTRPMDDDNLTASAKGVRDATAAWLGVDDGVTDRVRFEVRQERGRGYAVRVEIRGGAW